MLWLRGGQLLTKDSLRGTPATNVAVKDFWVACRGTSFAFATWLCHAGPLISTADFAREKGGGGIVQHGPESRNWKSEYPICKITRWQVSIITFGQKTYESRLTFFINFPWRSSLVYRTSNVWRKFSSVGPLIHTRTSRPGLLLASPYPSLSAPSRRRKEKSSLYAKNPKRPHQTRSRVWICILSPLYRTGVRATRVLSSIGKSQQQRTPHNIHNEKFPPFIQNQTYTHKLAY